MPPLTHLSSLSDLTLFDNDFRGSLRLGSATDNLQGMLLAQDNRLSCGLTETTGKSCAKGEMPCSDSLALLGNAFSAPIPDWEPMRNVPFLYYSGWWDSWGAVEFSMLCGFIGLVLLILFTHLEGEVHELLDVGAFEHPLSEIRLSLAKHLAGWSILLVAPLVCLYAMGADRYECGKPW